MEDSKDFNEQKKSIIDSGWEAIRELKKVAKEPIITGNKGEDLTPDKLKSASDAKKVAFFVAFEILNKIQEEERILEGKPKEEEPEKKKKKVGFAEKLANEKK